MLKRITIAIDGPAASGKSTTARLVAGLLGFAYVDTGAMYRAVTLAALRRGVDLTDEPAAEELAGSCDIELLPSAAGTAVLLDGDDVTSAIRSEAVTLAVSLVSSYAGVRRRLVSIQRALGRQGGVVMDGRDIGTVVFPFAELKIFLSASVAARARRRALELGCADDPARLAAIEADIGRRDGVDSSRAESPLVRAADAVDIDTTDLTIDEQVGEIVRLARARAARESSS